MNSNSDASKKIDELKLLENHLQNILAQKQALQIEDNEIENALSEIKKSADDVYKVVSGFMIKSDKDSLSKELHEKKKIIEMKISAMEKQETLLEKNADDMKGEIDKILSRGEKKTK